MKIKIAYLLLVHKCVEQINLFVQQLLEYGDCDVYIHLDKKSKDIQIKNNSRVFVYSEYDIQWGSIEIVKAAIYLMKKALCSESGYSHVYLGTGQDLIVKGGLYEYLYKHKDNIFIKVSGEIVEGDIRSARYKIKWPKAFMVRYNLHPYRCLRGLLFSLYQLGINVFPNRHSLDTVAHFFTGETWFIAPVEVINYILDYVDEHPDYLEYWENSLASDLMFFHTIIMNSLYADKVKDELMYVRFGNTIFTKNHPLEVTIEDDKEIEMGEYYFARKFEFRNIDSIQYYLHKTSNGD